MCRDCWVLRVPGNLQNHHINVQNTAVRSFDFKYFPVSWTASVLIKHLFSVFLCQSCFYLWLVYLALENPYWSTFPLSIHASSCLVNNSHGVLRNSSYFFTITFNRSPIRVGTFLSFFSPPCSLCLHPSISLLIFRNAGSQKLIVIPGNLVALSLSIRTSSEQRVGAARRTAVLKTQQTQ